MTLLLLTSGGVFLVVGAELLVRGASRLARALGLSPLVIGLTVVAYGTSMPETAVSVASALKGSPDIAIANVLGSNICNVLLILGISAIIVPLVVSRQLVRWDVPIMIGATLLGFLLCADGMLARWEGAVLFLGSIVYTVFIIRLGRREMLDSREAAGTGESEGREFQPLKDLAFVVLGLVFLVAGSRWFIAGAVEAARILGVSELVIGLTIVALGTSLPEVVTSILASLRGERDIAVGNVVGSNIFNILCVLGLTGVVAPEGIRVSDAALGFDFPVALAVAVACLPIFFTGYVIARWEGFVFLAYYVAYISYLFLAANGHDSLPLFSGAMVYFILPLTAITLAVVTIRALRRSSP